MTTLPTIFKPLLWSYDFDRCDPTVMEKTVIKQALNYGTMEHWRWIRSFYGDERICAALAHFRALEVNLKTKKLAELFFDVHF
jgi:hypothetical protein